MGAETTRERHRSIALPPSLAGEGWGAGTTPVATPPFAESMPMCFNLARLGLAGAADELRRSLRSHAFRHGAGVGVRGGTCRTPSRAQADALDVVRFPAASRPRSFADGDVLRHRLARR